VYPQQSWSSQNGLARMEVEDADVFEEASLCASAAATADLSPAELRWLAVRLLLKLAHVKAMATARPENRANAGGVSAGMQELYATAAAVIAQDSGQLYKAQKVVTLVEMLDGSGNGSGAAAKPVRVVHHALEDDHWCENPTTAAYNRAILSSCDAGDWEVSILLLEKMRETSPLKSEDDATYTAVAAAVAAAGAAEEAMGFNGGGWYTEYRPQKNPCPWFPDMPEN
jgi:hypothetical protein